mmetsp:Transcript_48882/g.106276  ORF Transcript_48882/g.106276 Transcript_48882/m.106276 type:complete len:225 (+) Transcript_48882:1130-1804(+)
MASRQADVTERGRATASLEVQFSAPVAGAIAGAHATTSPASTDPRRPSQSDTSDLEDVLGCQAAHTYHAEQPGTLEKHAEQMLRRGKLGVERHVHQSRDERFDEGASRQNARVAQHSLLEISLDEEARRRLKRRQRHSRELDVARRKPEPSPGKESSEACTGQLRPRQDPQRLAEGARRKRWAAPAPFIRAVEPQSPSAGQHPGLDEATEIRLRCLPTAAVLAA